MKDNTVSSIPRWREAKINKFYPHLLSFILFNDKNTFTECGCVLSDVWEKANQKCFTETMTNVNKMKFISG